VRHFQVVVDENIHRDVTLLLQSWVSVGQIGHEVGRQSMAV